MLRFTLTQLRYFIATAESESITEASKQVHVAQPAIASAISKLENQLGVELMIRHHAQGISLTPSGRKLLAEARHVIREAENFQENAFSLSNELSGELVIGSYPPLAPTYLPTLIKDFSNSFPQIKIKIIEDDQEKLVEMLRSGKIELVLLYDVDVPKDIKLFSIHDSYPYAILPKGHSLAKQKDVSLHDLAEEVFILFDIPSAQDYFTAIFERFNLSLNIAYHASSIEVLRGMVGWGLGVSLLVTRPFSDLTYDGNSVEIRPIKEKVDSTSVCIGSLNNIRSTKNAAEFVTYCKSTEVKALFSRDS
jgi:DNA-binding transcriptional LysR family regulator